MKSLIPITLALVSFLSTEKLSANDAKAVSGKAPQEDQFGHQRHTFFNFIFQDLEHSKLMLDWQENVTYKPAKLLEYQQHYGFEPGVTISGGFVGNWLKEKTNIVAPPFGGLFPILSRHPGERGNIANESDRWLVSNAAFAATIQPTSWFRFYTQYEYSEIEFPGQEDWTWRKYFGMIGDLDKFPVYGYFGRNTGDFGWMDGYNPFTNTVNNHYFRIEADEPMIGVGYKKGNFHLVGNVLPSGRHLRVADTEKTEGFNNGTISASYLFEGDEQSLLVGGSYLYSSMYNSSIAHHPDHPSFGPSRETPLSRNGVWDIYAEATWRDTRLGVEHTRTIEPFPATDFDISATTIQAAQDFYLAGMPTTVSASYGIGRHGEDGTPWEKQTQFILGIETDVTPNFSLSAEWVRNEGFVPLINITRVSNADVQADAFVIGGKINF